MPFYEYECESCRHHVEVLQKISDAPLRKCPNCGKAKLKRLLSAPVFRLKGSGWYETDFKSEKEAKRNLAGPEKDEGGDKVDATAKPAEPKPAEPAKGEAKVEAKADKTASRAAKPAKPPVKAKPRPAAAAKRKAARR